MGGAVYLALAHFAVLSAVSYGVELTNLAPCENVVVNSTTADNVTYTYSYADSCANRTTPLSAERLYVVNIYLVLGLFITVVIGGMVAFFKAFIMKW